MFSLIATLVVPVAAGQVLGSCRRRGPAIMGHHTLAGHHVIPAVPELALRWGWSLQEMVAMLPKITMGALKQCCNCSNMDAL